MSFNGHWMITLPVCGAISGSSFSKERHLTGEGICVGHNLPLCFHSAAKRGFVSAVHIWSFMHFRQRLVLSQTNEHNDITDERFRVFTAAIWQDQLREVIWGYKVQSLLESAYLSSRPSVSSITARPPFTFQVLWLWKGKQEADVDAL